MRPVEWLDLYPKRRLVLIADQPLRLRQRTAMTASGHHGYGEAAGESSGLPDS